jgi:nitrogen regulatory protein PII
MKLLVFILNQEELLEEVLEAYIEAGISGATIIDSEGMGHFLANEVPLFADFKDFMKGNKPGNKTILSIVTDEAVVSELKKILDDVMGGLEQPGSGIMFTVPVDWVSGFSKNQSKQEDPKA